MLQSEDTDILQWICRLMGDISRHANPFDIASAESIEIIGTESNPSLRLIELLEHKNHGVAKQAIYALSYVDGWAMKVKLTLSKATSIAVRMLESEDTEILECTCRMPLNILRHGDLLEIVAAESKLHLRLIALSEHAQTSVQNEALWVLARINEASTVGPTAAVRGDRG
ncbi:hypothetical protein C8J57DRAFT_108761 [Mycena rebaudengoi]|nr:hypothetical protein C8J57DRAFT_108761 [Mycena rebaudengoi]